MVFSNQRNWIKIIAVFFQKQRNCCRIYKFFCQANSIHNKFLFLFFCDDMKDKWCRNGKIRYCNLLLWYLTWRWSYQVITCQSNLIILDFSISLIQMLITWLRSNSCFRKIRFATSILCWSCNRRISFSVEIVLMKRKNFRDFLFYI